MGNRKEGRFWIPDWIVDYDVLNKMSLPETRVLLILTRFANKAGVAWPAVTTIAKMAGISPRSVQRALRSLAGKDLGLIAKITKGTGGRHAATHYRLFAQSWLNYKTAQESVADDILATEGPDGKGRHSPVGVSGKGRHSPVGVSSGAGSDKGRQATPKRATNRVQKGDRAMSGEGSKKELEKETALVKLTENIGRPIKATANNEESTRAEANRQKQALKERELTEQDVGAILARIAIC